MKLAHIHPEFKEDFATQRRYKKFALAVLVDSVGFKLGGQEFKEHLLNNYHSMIFELINPEIKDIKRRYRKIKKKIDERILEIESQFIKDSDFLSEQNYIFDLLGQTPESIDKLDFDDYKITFDIRKDLSKIENPYLELLDRVDEVQFL